MQHVLDKPVAPARESAWATTLADPWIGLAACVAIAIRLFQLDAAPLWFDEAVTAQWVALPWDEMVRRVVADYHPPLYFVLLKAWCAVAGTSPWALRLPSAFLSWLTVPVIAATGTTLRGRDTGRWAAWLAAVSPFLIHHGQEARMYALVAALAAINLMLLSRFATGAVRSLGGAFAVAAAALVASHYYGVFFVAGELLVLVMLWRRPLQAWLPTALATVAVILIALAAAVLLPTHRPVSEYALGWLAFPGVVWSMLAGYTLLPGSDDLHLIGWRAALTYLPLAMIAAVALAAIAAVGLREMRRIARLVVLIPLATALVGPFAVRVILPGGLNPRYFAAGLPGFLLFIASGMTTGARMRSGRLAIVVLALTMLLGVTRHLADPGYPREDIIGASEWLDANVSNDEELLVSSDEMAYLARFHWPQRRLTVYPPPGVVVSDDNADAVVSQLPSAGTQRVIYIFGRAWLSDPIGALQRTLRERYRSCGEATLRGIRILCLERSGSAGEPRAVTGANADMAAAPNAMERHP